MKNKKFKSIATVVTLSASLILSGGIASAKNAETEWKLSPEAKINWKDSSSTTPSFITGSNIALGKIKSEKDVQKFFKDNEETFGIKPSTELLFVSEETDDLGMTHYTYQPAIQKTPIDQSNIVVHVDAEKNLVAVNGEFHPNAPKKVKQSKKLAKQNAIDKAWKHIGVDRGKADKKYKDKLGKEKSHLTEKDNLVVVEHDGEYTLAYHVQLQFVDPYPANWQIWINAETGDVVQSENRVHEATGTGYGVLGDTKSLNTYFYNNTYYLFDTTKPMNGVIQTFDYYGSTGTYNLPGSYMTDTGNTFYSERQKAGVDAHYYAGEVFDYFYNTFGRVSYDNNGADITSTVHYGSNYNNAAWVGNQMIYGDGDGSTFTYLSGADDIVAHELTHAVTSTEANLVYSNQSGALNESFSDVFAYFFDSEDWLIGEDVYTPGRSGDALRSMSDPTRYGQPAHMNNYNNTTADNGGVHINSGIPNKAAYNTINSIGKSRSEQIYYRALTLYLTPNSNFSDARQALIQSARDLYGTSVANSVASAWSNVGVY